MVKPTGEATNDLSDSESSLGKSKQDPAGSNALHCTVCASLLRPPVTSDVASNPTPAPTVDETGQNFKSTEEIEVISSDGSEGTKSAAITMAEEGELPPFIALSCTGSCCRQDMDDNLSGKGGSTKLICYCTPGCFQHFLQFKWGLYAGLGQAHESWPRGLLGNACDQCHSDLRVVSVGNASLSLFDALRKVSPEILAKGLAVFDTAVIEKQKGEQSSDTKTTNPLEEDQLDVARRITQELEDQRLLKCPSCQYKIAIPEDRGCDAAWCENCSRAFCLFCLTDCGDNPKTDSTANHQHLIGDAHDHVMNNDCGLTGGRGSMHSGKTLARHHERQFLKRVALRLKRVPTPIRDLVCNNLNIFQDDLTSMLPDESNDDAHKKSMTELSREIENDKWEHYRRDMRVSFLHAAYRGDIHQVQSLLESGIPISIPDSKGGETALHFAATKGHLPVVKLLLEWGANPWQLSPKGRTPLDDLCNVESSADLSTARYLIQACMLSVPAMSSQTVLYPWERAWPSGTTAQESAKRHHADSPINSYFLVLKGYQGRLAIACTSGHTTQAKQLLSNTGESFPRANHNCLSLRDLPPARDLIWVYNPGSGCTVLLDLYAKCVKLSPQHLLECTKLILKASNSGDGGSSTVTSNKRLLQMRDLKHRANALHWLALDARPEIMKVAGLLLRNYGGGGDLLKAVDRRNLTPLEWAKNYVSPLKRDSGDADGADADADAHKRNVERWEALVMAWEEAPIEEQSDQDDVLDPGE